MGQPVAVLLDAHFHLGGHADDAASVLAEIRRRRVFSLAVARNPASYAQTTILAGDEPLVVPAFGVHPACAADWAGRLDELVPPLDSAAMLGEIGLDHHWVTDASTYPAQQAVFQHFLVEAERRNLVVSLHTKAAEEEIVTGLRRHGVSRAIVHWYAGPVRAFRELVDLGAYFSVGVAVLVDDTARAIAAEVPIDRLLTETDNPSGWKWLKGEEGRPSLLIEVQRELARVRGMSVHDLQDRVRTNFERLIAGDDLLEAPYRRARDSFDVS